MRTVLALLVVVTACGSLRENPLEGSVDGGVVPGDGDASDGTPDSTSDGSASDAAPPVLRADTACVGGNGWYQTGRTSECEARQLRVVQERPADAVTAYGGLDLAWSLAGRIGIVLSWQSDIEAGYLQALTFDTATPTFTVRPDRVAPKFALQTEGAGARIAARADGSFEVLSMLEEQGNGGDVLLRRLPVNQPFLPPSVVFTSADRSAQLGLLVHGNGLVTATAALPDGTDLAIVTRQRQPEAMSFDELPGGRLAYFKPGPAGNGNHRMALDSQGVAHIAYEQGFFSGRSQPRYARITASAWDFRRTVDNPTSSGVSGEDLSMILLGDEKNVVYVAQARSEDDTLLPYARIVRARWRGAQDPIEKSVLVDQLPLNAGSDSGSLSFVRAAAAADASGALHVVYSRLLDGAADDPRCAVFYRREAAAATGGLEWLEDDVSGALPCAAQTTPVALAVEPGGRPHVGYLSEGQGVVYATRYDR